MKIIAGLGNPGSQYACTRHNIGFLVLDALASRLGVTVWREDRSPADLARTRWGSHSLILVKPLSYMNKSGEPIQKIASYYKVSFSDLIVVHDDMDLGFGQVKIVVSRGAGGHNGIRSIIGVCGTKNFVRLRLGVGRPLEYCKDATSHVLGRFSLQEQNHLGQIIEASIDACEMILTHGVEYAMNRVNCRTSILAAH